MIKLVSDFLYNEKVGELGIDESTADQFMQTGEAALNTVLSLIEQKHYGYINLLDNDFQDLADIRGNLDWAKTLVVIGIGGSDLGGRAIQNAMDIGQGEMQVIFTGDTTDPTEFDWLFSKVNIAETIFNIVSKSGDTMEVIAFYAYLKQECMKHFPDDWAKHFLFTTTRDKGVLSEEAAKHQIAVLDIPVDVGGRYSVLTNVGLLPAKMMGVNLIELLDGARDTVADTINQKEQSVAFRIAWEQFLLYQENIKLAVLMPYSSRLNEFGRWFRQLWAESLGKDGKGILPIQARGPADQHSQLQYYTQGEALASYWLLKVSDHGSDNHRILSTDIPAIAYLADKEFGEIINAEAEGTALALTRAKRPNATLEITQVDDWHLGGLFMTFELAVTFLAEMLGVDAFNQPGVQESKDIVSALLGEPGFEELRAEIEELKN